MEVVVVVTRKTTRWLAGCSLGLCAALPIAAAVLPEDRLDALFHNYDGGGMEISGPSLLINKLLGSDTAVTGQYYVDSISSASIDVVTSASPYKEKRTEYSAGVSHLQDKSVMSLNYTHSEEPDFVARNIGVTVSQDFFGDLTTLSMGYSRGDDTVKRMAIIDGGKEPDPNFGEKDVTSHNFQLGLTQVMSKNLLLGLNYNLITDQGFLNNPYRQVRFADGSSDQYEKYPNTHTSHAIALQSKYYLPYRAALGIDYRFFHDTWDINANTFKLGYTQPTSNGLIYNLHYRWYKQSAASFYQDLFDSPSTQTLMARDKELSTFSHNSIGVKLSYDIARQWDFIDKGTINLAVDHMIFDYKDFRDRSVEGVPLGEEPLYSFSANVMQLYLSVWY